VCIYTRAWVKLLGVGERGAAAIVEATVLHLTARQPNPSTGVVEVVISLSKKILSKVKLV
jgi:hypothetical protein